MTYRIITRGVEKYSEQIQALGDRHRDRLGFLPASSFRDYANDNSLYCAVSGEQDIAYILFRYRQRNNSVLLVHVCVSNDIHLQGVGTELINTVIRQHPHAYYAEAKCRRDYNLNDFWKKAGFHVVSERAGRKMEGSTLTVWRRTIIKEDLLDLIIQQASDEKTIAVLDTNIVISLCDDTESSTQCLLDPLIHEDVLLCITPELSNEINKKEDSVIRAKHLQYASRFQQLSATGIDGTLIKKISDSIDPNGSHAEDAEHIVY